MIGQQKEKDYVHVKMGSQRFGSIFLQRFKANKCKDNKYIFLTSFNQNEICLSFKW